MNSSNDQLQDKKTVLEQELKRINLELANVLNLNDTLALENKEKDDTTTKKLSNIFRSEHAWKIPSHTR